MNPTSIELTNFKAIGEKVVIPIKPLTLIYGANSSGKSSILQCLSMLAQSVDIEGMDEPFLRHKGNLVDVGTFRDFIHGHDIKKSFSCKFNFDMDEKQLFDEFLSDLKYEKQLRHVTLTESAEKFKHIVSQFKKIGLSFRFEYNTENEIIEGKDLDFFLGDSVIPAFTYDGFYLHPSYEHEFWELYWKHFSGSFNEYLDKQTKNVHKAISEFDAADNTALLQWFDDRPLAEELLEIHLSKDIKSIFEWYLKDASDNSHYITSFSGFLPSHFANLEPGFYLCSEIVEPRYNDWNSLIKVNNFFSFHPLQLIVQVSAQLKPFLESFKAIGPLRKEPERYLIKGDTDNNRTRNSGGNSIMALAYSPGLVDIVNKELKQLQISYQLKVVQYLAPSDGFPDIFQLHFVNQTTGVSASIRDVGFGFSQILPIVIDCVLKSQKTLLIEQPELHLHPALQTELGDLFLRSVLSKNKGISSRKQRCFLIETHSEHLILRILRRIRETSENALEENVPKVIPDQVAVLYVQPGINGSEVVSIPINEEGEFTQLWPKGFFAERGRELF